jgi:predicted Zn-dependent protease
VSLINKLFKTSVVPVIESVGKIIDNVITTTEEKDRLKLEISREIHEYDIHVKQASLDTVHAYFGDVANARNMQNTALQQCDLFSKRFIYYLAAFWSMSAVFYIFIITYYKPDNERIADTVLGFLLGTIVATIINFFFGSSKGSSDKQALLEVLTNKI